MRIIIIAVILLNLHFGLLAQNEPTLDIVPNPFVDTTSFVFILPASDTVSLFVYNRWGQLIGTPVNEQLMPQGTHTVIFVGDSLPEDVYYVALIVDTVVVAKKLIKLNQFVGLENDRLEEQGMTIYPNPTMGLTTVTILPHKSARIAVYNALGKLVRDEELISQQIDLSYLPNGIYTFHVIQGKTTFRKKIIKL
ncbi:MAG: hypothetical protein COB85_07745 [Bacteroidetes bacterium]|nr:MAG: hypothetical protein COB85_07745 [Bacteroidota bacterium]